MMMKQPLMGSFLAELECYCLYCNQRQLRQMMKQSWQTTNDPRKLKKKQYNPYATTSFQKPDIQHSAWPTARCIRQPPRLEQPTKGSSPKISSAMLFFFFFGGGGGGGRVWGLGLRASGLVRGA